MTVDVGLNLLTGLSGTPFAGTANGHIEVIPWGMCDKILLDSDPAACFAGANPRDYCVSVFLSKHSPGLCRLLKQRWPLQTSFPTLKFSLVFFLLIFA